MKSMKKKVETVERAEVTADFVKQVPFIEESVRRVVMSGNELGKPFEQIVNGTASEAAWVTILRRTGVQIIPVNLGLARKRRLARPGIFEYDQMMMTDLCRVSGAITKMVRRFATSQAATAQNGNTEVEPELDERGDAR